MPNYRCDVCYKDFSDNKTNYDRHMGSKAHLSKLFDKVNQPTSTLALRAGGGWGGVGAPPTPCMGEVLPQVSPQIPAPSSISDPRIFIQQYKSSEVSVPVKPVPWTKVIVLGGGAVLLLVLVTQMLKPRSSIVSPQPQGMGFGGLTGALAGIGGLLFVSKSLRGEIKGWGEAMKSMDKAFGL